MDCLFCKIVKNEIPSAKIFENERVAAFFDINPLTKGHCLVVPKDHYEDVFSIPLVDLKAVITDAQKLAETLRGSLQAEGVNLVNASGDVTDIRHKQIGIASGQGICAALSAADYLRKLS